MDDIKSAILKISKTVTKTSGDLLKTTKLSVSLASEEEALKNLYVEIGKKVHEIYLYGGSLGKFFDEKYKELEAQESKIRELRDTLDTVKGVKSCPKCNKSVDKTAEFCSKCGYNMLGVPTGTPASPSPNGESVKLVDTLSPETADSAKPEATPEAAAEAEAPAAEKKHCRLCGANNDSTSKFCLSCGRMM